jgi:hypothetical protein
MTEFLYHALGFCGEQFIHPTLLSASILLLIGVGVYSLKQNKYFGKRR